MKRREFVTLVAGAATAWPLAVRSQQESRPKLVGVLWGASETTANRVRLDAFRQAMQGLHWDEGRNLKLELRWGSGDVNKVREHASELVALAPDVIVSIGSYAMGALRDATRVLAELSSHTVVLVQASDFWKAEDYHQRYFQKHGGHCHVSFAEVQNS